MDEAILQCKMGPSFILQCKMRPELHFAMQNQECRFGDAQQNEEVRFCIMVHNVLHHGTISSRNVFPGPHLSECLPMQSTVCRMFPNVIDILQNASKFYRHYAECCQMQWPFCRMPSIARNIMQNAFNCSRHSAECF